MKVGKSKFDIKILFKIIFFYSIKMASIEMSVHFECKKNTLLTEIFCK